MLTLRVEWLSDRGGRTYNEDACGHWRSDGALCAVLADGAGGHGGGDVASRLTVREVVGRFAAAPSRSAAELGDLLRDVNATLLAQQWPGTPQADMHTTVVCLVLDFTAHQAHWAHAGDSRLYWFRGGSVHCRTRDHSLVQSMVDAGMLEPDQVTQHPQRSELRSALGLQQDELEVEAADGADPVAAGDAFLLCTDGLWEYVDDATMERLRAAADGPRAWLDALAAEVKHCARHKARHDNFTALAVWTS